MSTINVIIAAISLISFGSIAQERSNIFDSEQFCYSINGFSEFDDLSCDFFNKNLDLIEINLKQGDTIFIWIDFDQNMIFNGITDSIYRITTKFHEFEPYNRFLKRLMITANRFQNLCLIGNKFYSNTQQVDFISEQFPDLIENDLKENISKFEYAPFTEKIYIADQLSKLIVEIDSSIKNQWQRFYLKSFFGKILYGEFYSSSERSSFVVEGCTKKVFFFSNQIEFNYCEWITDYGIQTTGVYLYSPNIIIGKTIENKYFNGNINISFTGVKQAKYGLFNARKNKFEMVELKNGNYLYRLR